MLVCHLESEADIGWALQYIDQGHAVRVEVRKPTGVRARQDYQAEQAERLLQQARLHGATVIELDHHRYGRLRRRRCLSRAVLYPAFQPPPGTAGVREPRRPLPGAPSIAAEIDSIT